MDLVIAAALVGAVIGAVTAKRRKGNLLDILQYGAGFALAFSIVGMVAFVIIARFMA